MRRHDLPGATTPRRWLLWLWLVVAALAVLSCFGAGAVAFRSRSQSQGWPEKAAEQYFGLLVKGDLDGAYAMLCTDAFVKTPRADYADFVYAHGHFDAATVTLDDRAPTPDGDSATVRVALTDHGRDVDHFGVRVRGANGHALVCDGVTSRNPWYRTSP